MVICIPTRTLILQQTSALCKFCTYLLTYLLTTSPFTSEGLRERTEHLDIFLFSVHHSIVFYF